MSQTNVYHISFQVVKANPASSSTPWQYRKELRKALVVAANQAAAVTALTNDISLGTGESVDVVGVFQESVGTEGVGFALS